MDPRRSRPGVGGGVGFGALPATVGMRRHSTASAVGGGFSGGGGSDKARGPRLSATKVLVMSLCFIGFVTALYIFGKLYRSGTAAASA